AVDVFLPGRVVPAGAPDPSRAHAAHRPGRPFAVRLTAARSRGRASRLVVNSAASVREAFLDISANSVASTHGEVIAHLFDERVRVAFGVLRAHPVLV